MSEAGPFEILPFDASHQEGVVLLAQELLCQEYRVQADLSDDPDLMDVAAAYRPPDNTFLSSSRSVIGSSSTSSVSTSAFFALSLGLPRGYWSRSDACPPSWRRLGC